MAASSLSGLLIESEGWRFDYMVTGVIGLGIGLSGYLLIQQPRRGAFDK